MLWGIGAWVGAWDQISGPSSDGEDADGAGEAGPRPAARVVATALALKEGGCEPLAGDASVVIEAGKNMKLLGKVPAPDRGQLLLRPLDGRGLRGRRRAASSAAALASSYPKQWGTYAAGEASGHAANG